ncbi:MAG TPA: GNAT family N-acetyltransferase [Actinomycetota bacterium]
MGEIRLVERDPTVTEYQRLRRAVGWGEMTDEGVAAGLPHALYAVVLVHGDEVIGCGRVVGDGGLYFYVQDVIVLPGYRGRGLGARIMEAVMAYLERTARPGAFIGLMAAEGVEGFYESYGFRRRPDDRPGMFRVWER